MLARKKKKWNTDAGSECMKIYLRREVGRDMKGWRCIIQVVGKDCFSWSKAYYDIGERSSIYWTITEVDESDKAEKCYVICIEFCHTHSFSVW